MVLVKRKDNLVMLGYKIHLFTMLEIQQKILPRKYRNAQVQYLD